MKFPEETLMAYVDDELDAPTRAAVEAAMSTDPELKEFVFRQQALRLKLRETFDRVLEEPVPERLLETARGASTSTPPAEVTDLAAARTQLAAARVHAPDGARTRILAARIAAASGEESSALELYSSALAGSRTMEEAFLQEAHKALATGFLRTRPSPPG